MMAGTRIPWATIALLYRHYVLVLMGRHSPGLEAKVPNSDLKTSGQPVNGETPGAGAIGWRSDQDQ